MNNPYAPQPPFGWRNTQPIHDDVLERLYGDTGHVPCVNLDTDQTRDEVEALAEAAAPALGRLFGLKLRGCSESDLTVAGVHCAGSWPTFAADRAKVPLGHVPAAAAAVAHAPQTAYAYGVAEMVAATPDQAPLLLTVDDNGQPLVTLRLRDLERIVREALAPLRVQPSDALRLIHWKREQVSDLVSGEDSARNPTEEPPCPWEGGWEFEYPPLPQGHCRLKLRRQLDDGSWMGEVRDYAPCGCQDVDIRQGESLRVYAESQNVLEFWDVVECDAVDAERKRCRYVRTNRFARRN
jgi:hypothetical protein